MSADIYSITILNHNSNIAFSVKQADFSKELSDNFCRQITKFIKSNYLMKKAEHDQDYYLSIDYTINSNIMAKITLVGKIVLIILYSNLLDSEYVELYSEGVKKTLFKLAGTKKININHFRYSYLDVQKALVNTINNINPFEKFMFPYKDQLQNNSNKNLYIQTMDRTLLGYNNIYFQRFFYANRLVKLLVYNVEIKEYNIIKNELNYNKEIEGINKKHKFLFNDNMINFFHHKKQKKKLKYFLIEK